MRAQVCLLLLIVCGCCATRPAPDSLVTAFEDRTRSDASLRRTYEVARQPATEDEGRAWVAIVRDTSRTPTARRLAFAAFARRFLRPGVDLREVVRTYQITDWFTRDRLLNWTYSSWTPLDRAFRLGPQGHRVFALFAPSGIDAETGPVRNAYVCFALPTDLDTQDLLATLHTPRPGDDQSPTAPVADEENLTLAGVVVVEADEDVADQQDAPPLR